MKKSLEKIEDEKVRDEDRLLRRVLFTDPNHIREDGTPTSLAFKLKTGEDGLSVDIERLTDYEKSILDRKRFRLFSLEMKTIKEMELSCKHDSKLDNPSHALITGEITKPKSRELARKSIRVRYPD